jgi:hypothetical protein
MLMRSREASGSEFLVATTRPKDDLLNDEDEAPIVEEAPATLGTATTTTGEEAVASNDSPTSEPDKLSGFSKLLAGALQPFKQRENGPRGDPVMMKRLTTLMGDEASADGSSINNLSPAKLLDLLSTSDNGDLVVKNCSLCWNFFVVHFKCVRVRPCTSPSFLKSFHGSI